MRNFKLFSVAAALLLSALLPSAASAGLTANLSLIKTDSPDPVLPNGALTYTLTLDNAGPDDATLVTVTDNLPTGVTFVSASPGCVNNSGTVTCNVGNLAVAAPPLSLTIDVLAPATSGTISNTANVFSADTDPQTGDNTDTEPTDVTSGASADLAVTKSDAGFDPVAPGAAINYTVLVQNNGPANATGVTLADNLPTGTVFVSASAGCSESGGTVTCIIGNLANGTNVTILITVNAPPGEGTIDNMAVVTLNEPDPNILDNTDTESTVVNSCVVDSQAPSVLAPSPITVVQTGCYASQEGATGTDAPAIAGFLTGGSASDNCDPAPANLGPTVGGNPADNSTVFPVGVTTVTFRFQDASGNTGTADSTVTVTLFWGDLDEDADVDAADLVTLANYLVANILPGTPPFNAPLAAADVNDNGIVDATDLVVLANFLVSNFPCLPQ